MITFSDTTIVLGGKVIVENLNFTVGQGEFVADRCGGDNRRRGLEGGGGVGENCLTEATHRLGLSLLGVSGGERRT